MMHRSAAARWIPVGYFAATVALAMMVLPSALRPPPQAPPTSAEFDANAPPDDNEVVLTDLGQGRSTTAGIGLEVPGVEDGPPPPHLPAPLQKARRGRCFGNPPRQTESLYSAPCAAAFVGENPGATAKGVTRNEINIGFLWGGGYTGPLREPYDRESADEVRYRNWQAYFNDRFEMYGRRIRLIMIDPPGGGPEADRAEVASADQQWPLFGFSLASGNHPANLEAIRRKAIVLDGVAQAPHSHYRRHHPYAYGWAMTAEMAWAITTELACKQFVGRSPSFNERMDPTFDYNAPRKWGGIFYEETAGIYKGAPDLARAGLAKCGGRLEDVVTYNLYDEPATLSAAVTRMRAAGVTTIFIWNEGLAQIAWTHEATNSGYFPEWFEADNTHQTNGTAQLYHQAQWKHAINTRAVELPRPAGYTDCEMAYKSQAPDGTVGRGSASGCTGGPTTGAYNALLFFANGIQQVGPNLTPETLWQGLKSIPCRPPVPDWSIGGCYREDDLSYPKYVSLAWWDPNARAPDATTAPGAYRFMYGGKRFKLGEIPTESPWFQEGITTPDDPVQHD